MWSKPCPTCGEDITFTNKSNYYRSKRRNSVCKSCSVNTGKFTVGDSPWNVGKTPAKETRRKISHALKGRPAINRLPDCEVFKVDPNCSSLTVRNAFLRISEYKCSCGNVGVWQNKPLTLQMDHINGNTKDNRKSNLRWLCPNCHTQTPTWGKRWKSLDLAGKQE